MLYYPYRMGTLYSNLARLRTIHYSSPTGSRDCTHTWSLVLAPHSLSLEGRINSDAFSAAGTPQCWTQPLLICIIKVPTTITLTKMPNCALGQHRELGGFRKKADERWAKAVKRSIQVFLCQIFGWKEMIFLCTYNQRIVSKPMWSLGCLFFMYKHTTKTHIHREKERDWE